MSKQLHNNWIVDTDAYKLTQWAISPPNLQNIKSYMESRLGSYFPKVIFATLQMQLEKHFTGQVITKEKIEEAEDLSGRWFGTKKYFNRSLFDYVLNKYGGYLPLKIHAVKEGSLVPINNILWHISATDEKCAGLVQPGETLLMQVWYGCTVATNDFYIKKGIMERLIATGTPELLPYMCHDFGFRATSCAEHAEVGGLAALINFSGSDTLRGDRAANFFYGIKDKTKLVSAFASEHCNALMYGPGEGEYEYVLACLEAADPHQICSIVTDSFDDKNFIDKVVTREDIMKKILERPGKTVFRQDSGDPPAVTDYNLTSLSHSYGSHYNAKGFKVLNPKVGLLQGDGMIRETIFSLYDFIISNKWSADNLATGAGSGRLVKNLERDTQRFAIKPSQMIINNEVKNVQKMPKGQPDKASKSGDLKLHKTSGVDRTAYQTISSMNLTKAVFDGYTDCLEPVFENGKLIRHQTFDELVDLANKALQEEL